MKALRIHKAEVPKQNPKQKNSRLGNLHCQKGREDRETKVTGEQMKALIFVMFIKINLMQ